MYDDKKQTNVTSRTFRSHTKIRLDVSLSFSLISSFFLLAATTNHGRQDPSNSEQDPRYAYSRRSAVGTPRYRYVAHHKKTTSRQEEHGCDKSRRIPSPSWSPSRQPSPTGPPTGQMSPGQTRRRGYMCARANASSRHKRSPYLPRKPLRRPHLDRSFRETRLSSRQAAALSRQRTNNP